MWKFFTRNIVGLRLKRRNSKTFGGQTLFERVNTCCSHHTHHCRQSKHHDWLFQEGGELEGAAGGCLARPRTPLPAAGPTSFWLTMDNDRMNQSRKKFTSRFCDQININKITSSKTNPGILAVELFFEQISSAKVRRQSIWLFDFFDYLNNWIFDNLMIWLFDYLI